MMTLRQALVTFALASAFVVPAAPAQATINQTKEGLREVYAEVPMPPGFQVVATDLHGPVFADARGHTIYQWPSKAFRNGVAGEDKGKPACDDTHVTESAGLMSIYPAGFELPDVEQRPSCTQVWPPLVAPADAHVTGDWTILTRKDGVKQWAYKGFPLYTSSLDQQAGDVLGTVMREVSRDDSAPRLPIGPPAFVPAGFSVVTTLKGRLLVGPKGMSVYTHDGDSATASRCGGACLESWKPVIAPAFFKAEGEWSSFERSPGISQIAYRGKPLYLHIGDRGIRSNEGSDEPGWQNVYTQLAPALPKGFSVQASSMGEVIADHEGRSIYMYNCDEDSSDQLSCDHPGTTQVYRLAVCGNGDPVACQRTWPYVKAPVSAKTSDRIWKVMYIDPTTGRWSKPGDAGALRIWTFRGRPVYTFAGDRKPGDLRGHSWGEVVGKHNGFTAFVLRNDYRSQ